MQKQLWQLQQTDLLDGHLIQTNCPICNGTGKTIEYKNEITCSCVFQAEKCLDAAQFPARFGQSTLGNLDWALLAPATLPGLIQSYTETIEDVFDEGRGLVCWGPPGNGKTHVAVGIGKIACALGYSVRFAVVADWLEKLRSAFDDHPKPEKQEWGRKQPEPTDAEFLILDDLGLESETPWVREKVYQLINHRWLEQLPTIITTNRNPDDLARRYGDGVVSRLWGSSMVLHFEGGDQRLAAR